MIVNYVSNRLAASNHPEVEANILARELNANPPLIEKIAAEGLPTPNNKPILADQILEALEHGALTADQIRAKFKASEWEVEKALTVLVAAGKIKRTLLHYHLVGQPSRPQALGPEPNPALSKKDAMKDFVAVLKVLATKSWKGRAKELLEALQKQGVKYPNTPQRLGTILQGKRAQKMLAEAGVWVEKTNSKSPIIRLQTSPPNGVEDLEGLKKKIKALEEMVRQLAAQRQPNVAAVNIGDVVEWHPRNQKGERREGQVVAIIPAEKTVWEYMPREGRYSMLILYGEPVAKDQRFLVAAKGQGQMQILYVLHSGHALRVIRKGGLG